MQNIDRFIDRDFSEIFKYFKKNIFVFLISGFIIMVGTVVFNQVSIPRYKIISQVLIKADDQNQGRSLSNTLNFSILGDNTNFNNELLKINSIPILEKVIKNLDLEISYYHKGTFKFSELYHDSPVNVAFAPNHPQLIGTMFELQVLNQNEYQLSVKGKEVYSYSYGREKYLKKIPEVDIHQRGKFGALIENPYFSFVINLDSAKYSDDKKEKIYFSFSSVSDLALAYQQSLKIEPVNEKVTSGIITYEASNSDKGIDIINMLTSVYIEDDLEKRNHLASVTIQYIDKLLDEVKDSLSSSERQLQEIKSNNQIYDVEQQSSAINC